MTNPDVPQLHLIDKRPNSDPRRGSQNEVSFREHSNFMTGFVNCVALSTEKKCHDAPVRRRVSRLSVLCLSCLLFLTAQRPMNGDDVAAICEHAYFHASLIQSLMYEFDLESTEGGLKTHVRFASVGSYFRIDREDSSGLIVQGRPSAPMISSTAFNGERQQQLNRTNMSLRLQNGVDGARYDIPIPHEFVYGWLDNLNGAMLRWDQILSKKLWDERFAEAISLGTITEAGRILEVVEFPQRANVQTRCVWKVYFATELGYLPIRYERRVESNGALSSTMIVDKYKLFDVDGAQSAIPIKISFVETGADEASLPDTMTMEVNEPSLKINGDVILEEGFFTLDVTGVKDIYDIDAHNAAITAAEEKHGVKRIKFAAENRSFPSYLILLGVNGALLLVVGLIFLFRRRSKKT